MSDCKRSIALEANNSPAPLAARAQLTGGVAGEPSTNPVTPPAAPATISNAVAVPESKRASFRSAIKLTVQ